MSRKHLSNVTPLLNEYTLQKNAENKQRQRNTFVRRRLVLMFFSAMILFTLPSITLYHSYTEYGKNVAQQKEAMDAQEKLKEKKASLKKQVKLLQDDTYVAKLARDKYYYSKEGERVYTNPDNQHAGEEEENNNR